MGDVCGNQLIQTHSGNIREWVILSPNLWTQLARYCSQHVLGQQTGLGFDRQERQATFNTARYGDRLHERSTLLPMYDMFTNVSEVSD